MRTRKMRLLSFVLALAMMLAIAPLSAFADDSDPMGTLIPNNSGVVYEITQAGTYQMKGTYDAPVVVKSKDVTINITDDIDYIGTYTLYQWKNYLIRVGDPNGDNAPGTVTIKNNGHTVRIKGDAERNGVVYADKVSGYNIIVDGGFYLSEDTVKGKELFYNYQSKLELKNIHAKGEMLLRNNGGTAIMSNSVFERLRTTASSELAYVHSAIINTQDGTLTLDNVDVSAEQGLALANMGGSVTVKGGSYSTKDSEYSAILANKATTDGTVPPQKDAVIEIDGATVKNSNCGLEAKDGKFILKDITFENNTSDIYLGENQKLDDVVDTTGYNGKPLTAKVTTENVGTTLETVKLATLTVEGGKVTVDATSIGDEAIETTVNDKTTTVKLPVGAVVTVAFDETAYADSNLEFGYWDIKGLADAETYKGKKEFTFEVPNSDVTIKAMPSTEPSDDGIDAATVVTGVAIGAGAAVLTYHIGTELYAEQVLGKGVAVPKTREDVALKAWELAGKPAVELNGEPLSEAAQAEKWAVESGLMQNDAEGNFNGAKKMNKLKALRVLDKAQKLG